MPPPNKTPLTKHWHKISLETLRGWAIFLLLLAVGLVSYQAYLSLRQVWLRREATTMVEEARQLLVGVEEKPVAVTSGRQYRDARESLSAARQHLEDRRYLEALNLATHSRMLLASLLDAARRGGRPGEAWFVAVEGRVEYRKADRGPWRSAASRGVLFSGDAVRTDGAGSARILFSDGTDYTVRPNTHFLVTRSRTVTGAPTEETIALQWGWVELDTAHRHSQILTPGAETRVARRSEAVVHHDRGTAVTRFGVRSGSMDVLGRDGSRRRLGEMQQVAQEQGRLSEVFPLPPRPLLLGPEDNAAVSLVRDRRLVLEWQPVQGATRYALQISRQRHFLANVIDVENRTKTHATLGLRGQGDFLWRVAAYGERGLKGPWSSPRRFRVGAVESGG